MHNLFEAVTSGHFEILEDQPEVVISNLSKAEVAFLKEYSEEEVAVFAQLKRLKGFKLEQISPFAAAYSDYDDIWEKLEQITEIIDNLPEDKRSYAQLKKAFLAESGFL